ncbi:MAG: Nif3-like dinuclear metal center hexameric protein [Oligoflexia bacterium]|nr:Nif3-like dinuclear metal center hexameric protein [Oligoflexia bacterium]
MPRKRLPSQTIKAVISDLDSRAPIATAESWDNVGLLVGDPAWKTSGAVVSVDLTAEALAEAKTRGYRLIVIHHPCIFPRSRGVARVHAGGDKTGLVFQAIRKGIAIAAFHTNFDKCAMEVPQAVATGLGLETRGRLLEETSGALVKLAVFVPAAHLEPVRSAVFDAGAGQIGNYDRCGFGVEGEGSFRGGQGTHPFIGASGNLEKTREIRWETVFPRGMQSRVLAALFAAHPYEEVAFDLYPVEQEPASVGLVKGLGYGFWGEFPRPKLFSDVCKDVKGLFKLNGFMLTQITPAGGQRVRKVAFVAGKGDSFLSAASSAGCDVFITGEVDYHSALESARRGVSVIELGHTQSERFYLSTMKAWLEDRKLEAVALSGQAQRIWLHPGGKQK